MSNTVEYRAWRAAYLRFVADEQPIELPIKTRTEDYEQPKNYNRTGTNGRINAEAVQAESH